MFSFRLLVRCPPAVCLSLSLVLALSACGGSDLRPEFLDSDVPLHLEDHLPAALVEGSLPPENPPEAVEWNFAEGPGDWKPTTLRRSRRPLTIERIDDGIRLKLTERTGSRRYSGSIHVDLPDWNREDWAVVVIRARTSDDIGSISLSFNLMAAENTAGGVFEQGGEWIDVIDDGAVHSYVMRADWSYEGLEGPWKQLGINFGSREPASLDVMSISVVPKAANYAGSSVGVANEVRGGRYHRRVLYSHAPGRIEYRVRVPEAGRLDVGLGVLRDDAPVTFRASARQGSGDPDTLFEQTMTDEARWDQQSADLSAWAGKTITLALEAEAELPGTVALWAAPTVSGARATSMPNVILYVIDAGGADYMSAYGYNRPTTPTLERLAAQGGLFEYAYSNSSWSKTSTPSFATSLQHSVLGGYKTDTDPIPDQAVTMAEHLHAAGYQTAVLTTNAYAGTMSSLDRGADLLREDGADPNSRSTVELHGDFWNWRETFPGEPYFVHFQTTDVHWPWKPSGAFAGLFVEPERRERFYEWEKQLASADGRPRPGWLNPRSYSDSAYEKTGIDRIALFDAGRGLYDECLAHQDWQLGRLVERLKATGEWEHTLLIVASDHGNSHGLGLLDSLPERPNPTLRSHTSRIPLVVVWPERIPGGSRLLQPVSMIDVLPTILDLADLPLPEVMQGRSLARLLRGDVAERDWEARPVIFDEFYVDWDSGELGGSIEMIDGRWGAVLRIEAPDDEADSSEVAEGEAGEPVEKDEDEATEEEEPPRFVLYDMWDDPDAVNPVQEEFPEIAAEYERRLEELWEAHRALAQRFSRSGEVPLTPAQLETLRSLGYIN